MKALADLLRKGLPSIRRRWRIGGRFFPEDRTTRAALTQIVVLFPAAGERERISFQPGQFSTTEALALPRLNQAKQAPQVKGLSTSRRLFAVSRKWLTRHQRTSSGASRPQRWHARTTAYEGASHSKLNGADPSDIALPPLSSGVGCERKEGSRKRLWFSPSVFNQCEACGPPSQPSQLPCRFPEGARDHPLYRVDPVRELLSSCNELR